MTARKSVLLVSHVPCSSGTFLTHYVARSFSSDPWIVPETSLCPEVLLTAGSFLPSSPLLLMQLSGRPVIDAWRASYADQLRRIYEEWMRSSSELLVIRDHAYSEYFSIHTESSIHEPFTSLILRQLGISFVPLLTHRNPVDSWLGLCTSFPQHSHNLKLVGWVDGYSKFLDSWRSFLSPVELSLESLVADGSNIVLRNLSRLLGLKILESPFLNKSDLSSGASGRHAPTPIVPPRRPISPRGAKLIRSSREFLLLMKSLGYKSPLDLNMPIVWYGDAVVSIIDRLVIKEKVLAFYLSKLGAKICYF